MKPCIKELSKQGQDTKMREAIDTLSARIAQLDKNFDLIRSNLYKVDLEYQTDFEPKWAEIRKVRLGYLFSTILSDSS